MSRRNKVSQDAFFHSATDFLTVMLLVVIPMVAMQQTRIDKIDVESDTKTGTSEISLEKTILVEVNTDGLLVNGIPIDEQALSDVVSKQPGFHILIKGGDSIRYERFAYVLQQLNDMKSYRVSIVI